MCTHETPTPAHDPHPHPHRLEHTQQPLTNRRPIHFHRSGTPTPASETALLRDHHGTPQAIASTIATLNPRVGSVTERAVLANASSFAVPYRGPTTCTRSRYRLEETSDANARHTQRQDQQPQASHPQHATQDARILQEKLKTLHLVQPAQNNT